jgi:alpha-beta hydrolase superfamily lysophospholipase
VLRLLGSLVLLLGLGCGGPTLEPWHTVKLSDEFTAAKQEEVRGFEGYRRLEDGLFSSLQSQVYAKVETGPAHDLVRYSAGSAADPQIHQPNWNRSFELTSEAPLGGVLLLHGMSDSPYSLRTLAERLAREGYWVLGLRLPGHGTAPSGLRFVSAADMAAAVRLGMRHLSASLGEKPIHMVGYSTGASLALEYTLDALDGTAKPSPASLVLISPAIRIHPSAALARFKNWLSILPGLGSLAWLDVQPEFDPYKYNSFATNAGHVVHRITRSVDRRIASRGDRAIVLPPVLVFKSTVDATVSTEATVDRLLARLSPNRHELVLFDINRLAANLLLLVSDPGPLTRQLMDDDGLPFAVTFVTNRDTQTRNVVALRKAAFSAEAHEQESLGLSWPAGVLSLSHVALPFSPDDPLYGRRPPADQSTLFLGDMAMRGERGLLSLPAPWLLRMRYNPFYEVVESRVLDWFAAANHAVATPD